MQNSLRSDLGGRERRGAIGIADDLHEAFAVAQVDEDDAAVVAAAMDPAHQRDGLAEVAAVDAAAVVSAFHASLRRVVAGSGVGGSGRGGQRARAARRTARGAARPARSISGVGDARRGGGGRRRLRQRRRTGARRGATTPIEMMYLSASSTDMSSSRTRALRHHHEVAAGRVGRRRHVDADVLARKVVATASAGVPVRNAIVQQPGRGNSTSSALRNALPWSESTVSLTCFTDE